MLAEQGTAANQLYSQITFPWNDVWLGIVMVYDASSKEGHVHCRLSWARQPDAADWAWVDPGGLTGKPGGSPGTSAGSGAWP